MQTSASRLKCVPQNRCGENEHFSECYSICPLHCGQHIQCQAMTCGGSCVCNEGCVLNASGKCILKTDCPAA